MNKLQKYYKIPSVLLITAVAWLLAAPGAMASSHSDAPLIKLDPQANLTDVYAFIDPKG